ncbi:hypothetical protein K2173_004793 [Erythroxylum novogranatense]|uniref:Protein kinase domain-containing protein n=1 Tax=Erythroxylum novogranatense TaxID=1862640 RepID=A0AAV8SKS9_9ROSI|nr:hypothetical protein K2173_004793 [Erythroxylum novogranatense]
MERNPINVSMDQVEMRKQLVNTSREPGHDGFQQPSHEHAADSLRSRSATIRVADLNGSEVKPVLNYSIQTGEEFAFEFMRDRFIPKKPFTPSVANEPNYATGYMELKGILGISHTGSESGSDISMLTIVERGSKEFERANSSLHEERSSYGSFQVMLQTLSSYENRELMHHYTSSGDSDRSSTIMKVLCSFGGKVLPRPSDGKLRYVGGETHIIRISRDISFQELKQKILAIYNEAHVLKYQLPGEDLDALVSVSCDEDLLNMMDEWNEVEDREGLQKLCMFLFSTSDLDGDQFGLGSLECDPEIQYVAAVNGIDLGSRRNSNMHGLASSHGNNLDELNKSKIDKEASRVETVTVETSLALFNGTFQSVQPILQDGSLGFETYPQGYHRQVMDHGELEQLPFHFNYNSPNYSPCGEFPYSIGVHGVINQQGLLKGQSYGSFQVQNSQMFVKEASPKSYASVQQKSDMEKAQPVEQVHSVPTDEVPVTSSVSARDPPFFPSTSGVRFQEDEKASSSEDTVNPAQVPRSCEDFRCSNLTSMLGAGCLDPAFNPMGLNHIPTQRVYYSESIPRDQAELLNRISKSDDSLGSEFLISHSDTADHNLKGESVERLHQNNLPTNSESTNSVTKQLYTDQTINDGLSQLQKFKEFATSVSVMNEKLSDTEDVWKHGRKQEIPNDIGNKDSENQGRVLKGEGEVDHIADNHKIFLSEQSVEGGLGHTALTPVAAVLSHKDHVSDFPDTILGGMVCKAITGGKDLRHTQPKSLTESSTEGVNQEISHTGVLPKKLESVIIEIDDRFPHDLLSEMFSKGIFTEDNSVIGPMDRDGIGVSVNMDNHKPKPWSYFPKLAQEESVQNDVSLIDQDHIGARPDFTKDGGGDSEPYVYSPLATDGVSTDPGYSQLNVGENNGHNLSGVREADLTMHSDLDHSQVKKSESLQFEAMIENLRSPESQYEDGNSGNRYVGFPPHDINTLQIIKNYDLEELKELGSGTFGTVYHGKWRGTDVAIKRLKKICFTGQSSEQGRLALEFWREAEILSKLQHPNVVAFYGVVQDGPGGTLATVAEYMVDGSLKHVLLRKDRYLDCRKRLLIAMDAAFGMEYLHSKNIVHFDLKCDNLLVNLKDSLRPICKVGDFGLSKIKHNTLVSGGVRGTLPWMAPELLNGNSSKVSDKVDVFSFGIVLWEILTGEEPYANMHYGAIIGGIVNNTLRPAIPSLCDPEWKRLMEQCWAPNPASRPSFTDIASRLRVMSAAACQNKAYGHKASK